MTPDEREDLRYSSGKRNPIALEEHVMFSLLPKSGCSAPKTVLDIGCGVGDVSVKVQELGFQVTGIDFSRVAVEKAKEQGINALHVDVDRDGLAFPDANFDVVWAGDVIEHVFDPLQLFSEMARVVKPDGRILFTVPNDFGLRSRARIALTGRSVQSNVYRSFRQCKHHTFFSRELLEFMLADAGLRAVQMKSVVRIPRIKQLVLDNRKLASWIGRVFIVRAQKRT